MCFKIDPKAERPNNTTVWKIFAARDGLLFSPHVQHRVENPGNNFGNWKAVVDRVSMVPGTLAYQLNVRKSLGDVLADSFFNRHEHYPWERAVDSIDLRSATGLYVWLSEAAGRHDLAIFQDTYFRMKGLVLIECDVHPTDWIYSAHAENGHRYLGAATYRALTPRKIVADAPAFKPYWPHEGLSFKAADLSFSNMNLGASNNVL